MASFTIFEGGRTLSAQTVEACWTSICPRRPAERRASTAPSGPEKLRTHVADLSRITPRLGELLSQRRPAQRPRRLRRDARDDGLGARGVRPGGLAQHRRRLLRHDAGPHQGDRRGGGEVPAAAARRPAAAVAVLGPRDARTAAREQLHRRSASGPTSPAPGPSPGSSRRSATRRPSASPGSRWRTAPTSSTSTSTRACSTASTVMTKFLTLLSSEPDDRPRAR